MLTRIMWNNINSHSFLVGLQNSVVTLEDSLAVSYKSKHTLLYDPAIMLLGTYPKELKSYVHIKTVYNVHSSFIHNCQNLEATNMSFCRWVDKLWYIQTMGYYYSVLKRNELSSHEKTWRNFKCILQSERSQSEKATYTIPIIWHSGKGKTTVKIFKNQWLLGVGMVGRD